MDEYLEKIKMGVNQCVKNPAITIVGIGIGTIIGGLVYASGTSLLVGVIIAISGCISIPTEEKKD